MNKWTTACLICLVLIVLNSLIRRNTEIMFFSGLSQPSRDVPAESKPRLVITGAAYNVGEDLPRLKQDLVNATQGIFDVVKVVVFENDSDDHTRQILTEEWNRTWPVDVIGEKGVRDKFQGVRTKILAHARNRILQHLQQVNVSFDYILSIDMDATAFLLRNVDECFNLPEGWAACCTNNYRMYYDLWALRTFDDWCPCDVWDDCCPKGEKCNFKKLYRMIGQRFRHIPALSGPIEVKSCFGGATLYDYNFVKQLPPDPYVGESTSPTATIKGEVCEHVSFSLHLRDTGGKLYIQPKMLTFGVQGGPLPSEIAENVNASMLNFSMNEYYKNFPPI